MDFLSLKLAVLTISDSRDAATDRSGPILVERAQRAGHQVIGQEIIPDDFDKIVSKLQEWMPKVDVILTTGGTGITGRDVTPEALEAVATKAIPGFGELFRHLSFASIGTSTIQSRACAVVAGATLIFALPGSSGAVRDAWDGILEAQLDARHRPCNFAELLGRLQE